MSPEKIDFAALLAVLEAKRSALDTLIASYKAALSIGALGQVGEEIEVAPIVPFIGPGASTTSGPIDLPTGAFLGKSIPAAIKLYLGAARRKQTIKDIAAALREGGMESNASNFEGPITGALNRLKAAGEVLRFKDGWALAELYPEHIRSAVAAENGKPKKAARKRAAKARRPPKTATRRTKEKGSPAEAEGHVGAKLVDVLRERLEPTSARELAALTGIPAHVVSMTLGRLRVRDRVSKDKSGRYSVAS
jgi:hypothetical protein